MNRRGFIGLLAAPVALPFFKLVDYGFVRHTIIERDISKVIGANRARQCGWEITIRTRGRVEIVGTPKNMPQIAKLLKQDLRIKLKAGFVRERASYTCRSKNLLEYEFVDSALRPLDWQQGLQR